MEMGMMFRAAAVAALVLLAMAPPVAAQSPEPVRDRAPVPGCPSSLIIELTDGPEMVERKIECHRKWSDRQTEPRVVASQPPRGKPLDGESRSDCVSRVGKEIGRFDVEEYDRHCGHDPRFKPLSAEQRASEAHWAQQRRDYARATAGGWHWVASRWECVPVGSIWPDARTPEDVVLKLRDFDPRSYQTNTRIMEGNPIELRVLRSEGRDFVLTRTAAGCVPAQRVFISR